MDLPFADEIKHYWKTSRTSPDAWITKTIKLIKELGSTDIAEGFGSKDGRAVFLLSFTVDGEKFRIAWPVLPTRKPDDQGAARIQAATLLYHDCKSKALSAAILGTRTAFIGALCLPDGRTVAETSLPQISEHLKSVKLLR